MSVIGGPSEEIKIFVSVIAGPEKCSGPAIPFIPLEAGY